MTLISIGCCRYINVCESWGSISRSCCCGWLYAMYIADCYLYNERLRDVDQQFHQNKQNERSPLISNLKFLKTYDA